MMQARIGLVTLLNSFEVSRAPNTAVPVNINKKIFLSTPTDVYLKLKPIQSVE